MNRRQKLFKPPHTQNALLDFALFKQLPKRLIDGGIGRQQLRRRRKAHRFTGDGKGVFLRLVKIKKRVIRVAQQHVVAHIVTSLTFFGLCPKPQQGNDSPAPPLRFAKSKKID